MQYLLNKQFYCDLFSLLFVVFFQIGTKLSIIIVIIITIIALINGKGFTSFT
jgi:hypothetical protein